MPLPAAVAAIVSGDSHATIALKQDKKLHELSVYYLQEGVKAGVVDNIKDNVPSIVIYELKDDKLGFASIFPKELLVHIRTQAKDTSIKQVSSLLKAHNVPIIFEGPETLTT